MSLVVVAAVGVCASPAWGAFRGRDGDLVVATGAGLELVAPGTGAASSICTDVALCGHPAQPIVSPNGRAIAFVDTASGRPVVIAADGSCLWCLMGAPLTSLTGSEPAFTPGGQAVTVVWNGLWSVEPHRPGRASPPQGAGGQRCLVVGWARCAGARGLDLGRAARAGRASPAGAGALPVVFTGRREACARSRRLCVDRAGRRRRRAAAGSGWCAGVVAERSAHRLHRSVGRGRDRWGPWRMAASRGFGAGHGGGLAAVTKLPGACVQTTGARERARIEP